jgi:mRNA interferase MazF
LKKDCSIHCDELISISKSLLTDFIGRISPAKLLVLDKALKVALALEN